MSANRRHLVLPRRRLLAAFACAPAVLTVAGAFRRPASAQAPGLPPTPACDDEPTPRNPEGPFFTPDSPRRTSLLEEGIDGVRLVLSGVVRSPDCRPIPGALLDFWQADARGRYDNEGYRLRGHQFTDPAGRYQLETVIPGEYGPRTAHIHVKVQAPQGPLLATQLYFPGHPRNRADALFRPDLLVTLEGGVAGPQAQFDFVLLPA